MAIKYSRVVNEPIKDILKASYNGHIPPLIMDFYDDAESLIPFVEYFGAKKLTALPGDIERVDGPTACGDGRKATFRPPASASHGALPHADR